MSDLSLFDYNLPEKLIATAPAESREMSRLLAMDKNTGEIVHERNFSRIKKYLHPGDLLILNDARVLPARFQASRKTGGKVEILLVRPSEQGKTMDIAPQSVDRWIALIKCSGTLQAGETLDLSSQDVKILVEKDLGAGYMMIRFKGVKSFQEVLESGRMPLPPYIQKARRKRGMPQEIPQLDQARYQTVYAHRPGAVAAPTAGLHFTEDLLSELKDKGVEIKYLTLLVGPGTFMPVRSESVEEHSVEPEFYHIPEGTGRAIETALSEKRRVVSTGTTCVRVLEHLARTGNWKEHAGWTDMYIYPPFEFRVVSALITNFHLPKSSLIILVSAFAGREKILKAYREALAQNYRFYSYGDATFLF